MIEGLYASYAAMLSDGRVGEWPEFFVDDCRYEVISRANYERGLPLTTMLYESKGALVDRIAALDNALVYAPRSVAHIVGSVAIVGRSDRAVRARSAFATYQTFVEGSSELFVVGRTFDEIDVSTEQPLFRKRVVVFDTELVPGALVYPL
jgi:3-phenylpropionate/cinnamic acid dioxygenase small subunit